MRVLVTGGSGLLGGRVAELLKARHDVVASRHHAAPPPGLETVDLDLASDASIEAALDRARPDAVVHSAAMAEADRCEADPAAAQRCNVDAPRLLARLCQARGVRLVAFSTDLVFAGDRRFVDEAEEPRPLLVYGRTKRDGERVVLAECPGAAVLRVALVHGRGYGGRGTVSEAIGWALAGGGTPRLFVDQFRTPVDPESLSDLVLRLLASPLAGVLHAGGPERVSRYDIGVRVARRMGLPEDRVTPIRQGDVPSAAPRPADVSMDTSRARRELGWAPRALDVALGEGRPASERA